MRRKIECYGLSCEERSRLLKIWNNLEVSSRDIYGDFDAFAKWSAENGFALGKVLTAVDFRKPRGPGNAYWHPHDQWETDAQKAARVELTENPCITCPQNFYCDRICYLRKKWWDIGMEKIRERLGA